MMIRAEQVVPGMKTVGICNPHEHEVVTKVETYSAGQIKIYLRSLDTPGAQEYYLRVPKRAHIKIN